MSSRLFTRAVDCTRSLTLPRRVRPQSEPRRNSSSRHDGSRGANFSSYSQNSWDYLESDYRLAIQSFCYLHHRSLSHQGDTGTVETTSGGAPSPVAGGAWTYALRYP